MKLLVSCRDVGSVLHMVPIIKYALNRNIQIEVVAQKPALNYFKSAKIKACAVNLPTQNNKGEVINFALEIINKIKPDAILCGLSTPFDGGIDEALFVAAKGKCQTFMMQDFWGECNSFFGEKPDYVLCLDAWAAALTKKRYCLPTFVVGAPKYREYGAISHQALRREIRQQVSISLDATVIGFFGQALHRLAGYRRTILAWSQAVRKLTCQNVVVYRPHPRESSEDKQVTLGIFYELGLNVIEIPLSLSSESALSVCNVVCSPFSNCSYDAAHLNYFSDEPFIVPINLLFDSEIRSYCFNVIHLKKTPFANLGVALTIESEVEIGSILNNALNLACRKKIWLSSKKLGNPEKSAEKAIKCIEQTLENKISSLI